MSGNTGTDIWVAGAFAAFTVDLLVYPLDTLKTRLQSADFQRLYVNGATGKFDRALYRGLYQGVGSVIIATLPSSGAFFTTYEFIKARLTALNPSRDGKGSLAPQALVHSVASASAELVSCFILTPAEVIKQNAQMLNQSGSQAGHRSFRDSPTMRTLRHFRHPTQLWRGYSTLAARNLPFTAMQFPMFEHLKAALLRYRRSSVNRDNLSITETGMITAVSAGMAGSVAAILTTPIDVIKTRIMLTAGSEDAPQPAQGHQPPPSQLKEKAMAEVAKAKEEMGARERPSSFAIGREIWRQEGMKGLWRGGALRGTWTAVGSGLYLGVYETGRLYLEQRRDTKGDGDRLM